MVSLGKRDSSVSPVPRQELVCVGRGKAEIYVTGPQMPGERFCIGTILPFFNQPVCPSLASHSAPFERSQLVLPCLATPLQKPLHIPELNHVIAVRSDCSMRELLLFGRTKLVLLNCSWQRTLP